MIVQYYYPLSFSSTRMDSYLASGWFRNAALMYRSQLVCLNEDYYSVINIRLPLKDYQPKKRLRKLYRQNNAKFNIKIQKLEINDEKEQLYENHKKRFEGFIYRDLKQFFYGEYGENEIFDTYEVGVYDGEKLIGVSFFDKGRKSMAGLLGLYDEAYAKYSIGNYTMLLEILYAKEQGILYYYPGYILDKPSIFDYKMKFGEMQFFDWEREWKPLKDVDAIQMTSDVLRDKMNILATFLKRKNVPFVQYLYPLFSIGYFEFEYVKSPVYFSCFHDDDNIRQIIVEYNLEDNEYLISRVFRYPIDTEVNNIHISDKLLTSELHALDLLSYEIVYFKSPNPEFIAKKLKDIFSRGGLIA